MQTANLQSEADLAYQENELRNTRISMEQEHLRLQQDRIGLQLGDPVQAVLIPRGSFYQAGGGLYVYVVNEDETEARRRPVRIGRQNTPYNSPAGWPYCEGGESRAFTAPVTPQLRPP